MIYVLLINKLNIIKLCSTKITLESNHLSVCFNILAVTIVRVFKAGLAKRVMMASFNFVSIDSETAAFDLVHPP